MAIINHFKEVKKDFDIDILLYNYPQFDWYKLTAKEIKVLVAEGVNGSVKAAHDYSDCILNLSLNEKILQQTIRLSRIFGDQLFFYSPNVVNIMQYSDSGKSV